MPYYLFFTLWKPSFFWLLLFFFSFLGGIRMFLFEPTPPWVPTVTKFPPPPSPFPTPLPSPIPLPTPTPTPIPGIVPVADAVGVVWGFIVVVFIFGIALWIFRGFVRSVGGG